MCILSVCRCFFLIYMLFCVLTLVNKNVYISSPQIFVHDSYFCWARCVTSEALQLFIGCLGPQGKLLDLRGKIMYADSESVH